MSTTYESKVLIGYDLEQLFLSVGQDYKDMWDFRDAELGGMEESTCGFIGYVLMGDCEEVTGEDSLVDFDSKQIALLSEFSELTGRMGVMKCCLTSY